MEKIENVVSNYSHNISLSERKHLLISGVKKIENFDEEEFMMETNMGILTVKGECLELIKLDTTQGNISIKGKVNSIEYTDNQKNKDNKGLFNKIFK